MKIQLFIKYTKKTTITTKTVDISYRIYGQFRFRYHVFRTHEFLEKERTKYKSMVVLRQKPLRI